MKKINVELTSLQLHKLIEVLEGYRHDQRDSLEDGEKYILDFIQVKLNKEYKKVNPNFRPFY